MKCSLLALVFLAVTLYDVHADDEDFMDWILEQPLHRVERSPDYGAGLGGPLAASSWTPPGGKKPASATAKPAPKSAEKPKPTTKKAATTTAPKGSKAPAASSSGPTAPTKAPAKDLKGGGGGGTNGRSGEDIANDIYNHPDECKDPPNGGVWAPLPTGQSCGSEGNCPYPQKWCAAKMEDRKGNPKLSCQDLTPECQKVLAGGGGGSNSGTSPAPDTTTRAAETTTTSTATTTKPTTRPTTKATEAPTTTAAAASTAATGGSGGAASQTSGDCKDNHPYCCFWADDKGRASECDRNSKWMKSMCAKSCGTCGCATGDCPTKVNTAGCQFLPGGQGQPSKTTIFIGGQPSNAGFGAGNGLAPGGNPGLSGGPGLGNTGGAPGLGNAAGGPGLGNSAGGPGAPAGLTRIIFG